MSCSFFAAAVSIVIVFFYHCHKTSLSMKRWWYTV